MKRMFKCRRCRRKKKAPSDRGRMPVTCDECKPRHKAGANRERDNARDRTRLAAQKTAPARELEAMATAYAAGLSVHPDDPRQAALFAGIDPDGHDLAELDVLARAAASDVIEGDPEAFGRRCLARAHLLLAWAGRQTPELHPRDAYNAVGRLLFARDALVGKGAPNFADVTVQILGPEG